MSGIFALKVLKSDNFSLSCSRKCWACFLRHGVLIPVAIDTTAGKRRQHLTRQISIDDNSSTSSPAKSEFRSIPSTPSTSSSLPGLEKQISGDEGKLSPVITPSTPVKTDAVVAAAASVESEANIAAPNTGT